MSAWGNKDDIASPGTVALSGLTVTGTGTFFANNYTAGDVINITDAGGDAVILSITNNTILTLASNTELSSGTLSGKAYTVSEKPIAVIEGDNTTLGTEVFGVDATEVGVKFFRIASAAIANTGSGFANNAKVQIGGGTGTAANVNITTDGQGVPTSVTIVNDGRYTVLPTLTNNLPSNFIGSGLRLTLTATGERAANVAHAGWVKRSAAYTDAQGNRREKSEVLVAMSTITGDAADDANFPDS
jgi:hypothetical protein